MHSYIFLNKRLKEFHFPNFIVLKVFTNLPNCGLGEEYKPLPSGPAGSEDMEVTFWSRTFSIQDRSL